MLLWIKIVLRYYLWEVLGRCVWQAAPAKLKSKEALVLRLISHSVHNALCPVTGAAAQCSAPSCDCRVNVTVTPWVADTGNGSSLWASDVLVVRWGMIVYLIGLLSWIIGVAIQLTLWLCFMLHGDYSNMSPRHNMVHKSKGHCQPWHSSVAGALLNPDMAARPTE